MQDLGTIRKQKGMSISQLASKSGISIALLVQYETGEQEIPRADRARLAKALYVNREEINRRSSPPPDKKKPPARSPQPKESKKAPPSSPPARDTQIEHLMHLATKFGITREALEEEIGKPLDELSQAEARTWNAKFMRRLSKEKSKVNRKRGRLPESVDSFELNYLQTQQEAGVPLHFTLFDGQTFEGAVVGFSPYQITLRESGGDEITLSKLAIAYYRKPGVGGDA